MILGHVADPAHGDTPYLKRAEVSVPPPAAHYPYTGSNARMRNLCAGLPAPWRLPGCSNPGGPRTPYACGTGASGEGPRGRQWEGGCGGLRTEFCGSNAKANTYYNAPFTRYGMCPAYY